MNSLDCRIFIVSFPLKIFIFVSGQKMSSNTLTILYWHKLRFITWITGNYSLAFPLLGALQNWFLWLSCWWQERKEKDGSDQEPYSMSDAEKCSKKISFLLDVECKKRCSLKMLGGGRTKWLKMGFTENCSTFSISSAVKLKQKSAQVS